MLERDSDSNRKNEKGKLLVGKRIETPREENGREKKRNEKKRPPNEADPQTQRRKSGLFSEKLNQ